MNTACSYLSHPAQGSRSAIYLHDHLAKVAASSKEIAERMSHEAGKDAYIAGLLHDIGKLSPWYQERFAGKDEIELNSKYGQGQHSPFSAWIAMHLLFGKAGEHHVTHSVASHHTRLRTYLRTPRFPMTAIAKEGMLSNLKVFLKYVCSGSAPESDAWRSLDWKACMGLFSNPMNFSEKICVDNGSIITYLHTKCVFSSLLQADHGSFHRRMPKSVFSILIQPTHDKAPTSNIGRLRKSFQDAAFDAYLKNSSKHIVTIEAPTGIGKTDLIFRILEHHSKQKKHERAFYFSPLLALNDGFVNALKGDSKSPRPAVPRKSDWNCILEYNHITAEPISWSEDKKHHSEDSSNEQNSAEFYKMASFNYPFVVSTTARLLLTIYGNLARNCIKFVSLSNAVIVIDEIQTVPKVLLKSLVSVMSWIAKSSGSKVIFISATTPSELSEARIYKICCDEQVARAFTALTPKTLSVTASLDIEAVKNAAPTMTAVIFNTRRRAAREFCQNASMLRKYHGEVIYLTTGIRKRDRLEHIREISHSRGRSALVISTQVLEAGVDASFGRVFREMAPLDRIVQAMGRVNRHGDAESAEITIFDRNPSLPYRDIEICETQKILDSLTANGTVASTTVYAKLHEYYERITSNDCKLLDDSEKLEDWMSEHNYDKVWEMVCKAAFTNYNVNVLLPYPNRTPNVELEEQFDSLQEDLNSVIDKCALKQKRDVMRRAARLSASLPEYLLERVKSRNLLDPELLKHDICFPRDSQSLGEIYDQDIGLDKWIAEETAC